MMKSKATLAFTCAYLLVSLHVVRAFVASHSQSTFLTSSAGDRRRHHHRPHPLSPFAATATTKQSSFSFSSSSTAASMMSSAILSFDDTALPPNGEHATIIIAKKDLLREMAKAYIDDETIIRSMLASPGTSSTTYLKSGRPLCLCILPDTVSRNNHPLSVHTITSHVQTMLQSITVSLPSSSSSSSSSSPSPSSSEKTVLIQVGGVTEPGPIAAAIARALPLYSRKTTLNDNHNNDDEDNKDNKNVICSFWSNRRSKLTPAAMACCDPIAIGVRFACQLMDMTPAELTTDDFSQECRAIADQFQDKGVRMEEIVGDDLEDQGYGGLYGVGKGATCPPRLIVFDYTPPDGGFESASTVALVGKGIVYDTGGLSLKSKTGMPGMKHDMGGAAGLLGAFISMVLMGVKSHKSIKLVLCVAENAIGPLAVRNDDILTLYSGKTVEINNSDAEGRLVLGDGVAHATKNFSNLDLVVDMATLTGAQLVATGKKHAGILANTLELEQRAVSAGLMSGDLAFPLLYAPELLKSEFNSKVADMKNSVKDRGNAQSSCAGHFIESHLDKEYKGGWLHVDMAGPGSKDERGTGYGVAFILALLGAEGFC